MTLSCRQSLIRKAVEAKDKVRLQRCAERETVLDSLASGEEPIIVRPPPIDVKLVANQDSRRPIRENDTPTRRV